MCLTSNHSSSTLGSRKKTLVLDLDETLVHCQMTSFGNVTAITKVQTGDRFTKLFVSKRPGLEDFIARVAKCYNLILFTSGLKEYAHNILRLFKIDHYFSAVYHRSYCQKNSENKFEKDLAIFGIHPSEIILVDDSIVHVKNQPNNILLIKPYKGESDDCELTKIASFLEGLADKSDVRPVMDNFINFEIKYEINEALCPVLTTECDPEDFSEADFECELTSRVPSFKPHCALELKSAVKGLLDLEASEDDAESTNDSVEEFAVTNTGGSTSHSMKFPLGDFTSESSRVILADKLPTMAPKSLIKLKNSTAAA